MTERRHILLVDDDEEVGRLVSLRLDLEYPDQFELRTVSGNFEVELLQGGELWEWADLLVLDLWLVPSDARTEYPVAHQIFAYGHDLKPLLPVILFSAVVALRHSQDLEEAATKVFTKTSLNDLSAAVGELLNLRSVRYTPLPAAEDLGASEVPSLPGD